MTRLETILTHLNKQEFIKILLKEGNIFLVGGIVRDSFLDIESKDIDLIVTEIPHEKLIHLLKSFGKVNFVGNSFGVLKFVPSNMELLEPIDIALPRVETSVGVGHKDFKVEFDHNIPITDDLKRRDFTINAIAINIKDGSIVDPFYGINDLNNKIIRMVDNIAFVDDPLRMLRAIQFACRLNFKIENLTFNAIKGHANDIQFITAERITIELDKIKAKGKNIKNGFELLVSSGLFKHIFGINTDFSNVAFEFIKSRGDFFFTLLKDFSNKTDIFKTILKGDNDTAKEIEAIQFGFENCSCFIQSNRIIAAKMFKISRDSFNSGILPFTLLQAISELKQDIFPKRLKDLKINGTDLIAIGLKGSQIGNTLNKLFEDVLTGKIKNDTKILLNSIKNENGNIYEF